VLVEFIFLALSLIALISALGMISFHQPINSVLSFIVTLLSIAGLFALLSSSFIFIVQVIIYAGAIMSLILFVIMFLNIKEKNIPHEPKKALWISGSLIAITPFTALLVSALKTLPQKEASIINGFGSINAIGEELFSKWVLPFELISILLLIALLGAIVLAKKERNI